MNSLLWAVFATAAIKLEELDAYIHSITHLGPYFPVLHLPPL